ncbi:MAG: Hsp20/alpha crystallin family protein [Desulfobacter postgatei]|jgi:HSP20 family molecular chaperone IbpA|uniref:Molecular chaperone (Small heat shock protein) n=1 Tax=Desulfobacter postgatei 2ac9 TaxID=879212 RepID=I5AYK2_9BACT|nr:Hsp20/alpha crystallin family protein [Desulfobacter postgatei]EIM62315.1 molecular chaperone (small heat shock protein) [Desulfobacter postgatei 2ac9]MDD4274827.1 Hsp20/alpha crystallin family protein [Desulfobacter postgatei]MDX9964603.1 Hsp20/alpha crystallin family protein [Desulfobacter postgatei]
MDRSQEIAKQEEKNIEKTKELYEATPAVDIYENEDEILIYADMPGVVKDDISVDIDNGTLSISGVRKLPVTGPVTYEEFSNAQYVRNFSVPQTIDVEKVEAELKNGVLRLHLPKSEAAKPRQIEIKSA